VTSDILHYIAERIGGGNGALIVIESDNLPSALSGAEHIHALLHSVVLSVNAFRADVDEITGNQTVRWSTRLIPDPVQMGSGLPAPALNECVIVVVAAAVYRHVIPFYQGTRPLLKVDLDAHQVSRIK